MILEERKGCRYIRSQHRKCNTESLFVSCIMRKEALLPASPVFSKHRGPRRFHNFVLAYPTLSCSFPAFLLFPSPLAFPFQPPVSCRSEEKKPKKKKKKRTRIASIDRHPTFINNKFATGEEEEEKGFSMPSFFHRTDVIYNTFE